MSNLIASLKANKEVTLKQWENRVYISFVCANSRMAGDNSLKVYLTKSKEGVFTIEIGNTKGTMSSELLAALEAFCGSIEAIGATMTRGFTPFYNRTYKI